jgi:hypothetical protein
MTKDRPVKSIISTSTTQAANWVNAPPIVDVTAEMDIVDKVSHGALVAGAFVYETDVPWSG